MSSPGLRALTLFSAPKSDRGLLTAARPVVVEPPEEVAGRAAVRWILTHVDKVLYGLGLPIHFCVCVCESSVSRLHGYGQQSGRCTASPD